MRIISKFKDYYDSAMSTGVDHTIVYVRNESIIQGVHLDKFFDKEAIGVLMYFRGRHKYQYTPVLVYVAGKLYPLIRTHTIINYVGCDIYFHTLEDVLKFDKESKLNFIGEDPYTSYFCEENLRRFFEINESNLTNFFIENKIVCCSFERIGEYDKAIFVGGKPSCEVTINPMLKKYDFAKVLDPYTIFQEKMMWISGVLGSPSGEMVTISDKDMVVSKGFDPVYGFRKRKNI